MVRYFDLTHVMMSVLFLAALSLGKTPDSWLGSLDLSIPFILLFFWALFEEDIGLPYIPFVLGFAQDALTGTPFGLWSAAFMVFYILCLGQVTVLRTVGTGTLWLSFILLSGVAYLGIIGLVAMMDDVQVSLSGMIWMVLTSWGAFPILAIPLRHYLSEEELGRF